MVMILFEFAFVREAIEAQLEWGRRTNNLTIKVVILSPHLIRIFLLQLRRVISKCPDRTTTTISLIIVTAHHCQSLGRLTAF